MLTETEYNEAIDLWADDIYRFAMSCCHDADRSRDAVQEAFVKMWEQRDKMSAKDCKGYLIIVTQSKLRDAKRHDKVMADAEEPITMMQSQDRPAIEQLYLRDALEKAMEQLTELQRTILTLHDLEGYDYSEIATMMKIKYRNVQVQAFRARVRMRKLLTLMGFGK